jgi:hypothetical protein
VERLRATTAQSEGSITHSRRLRDIARFAITRGGAYCFLTGIQALRWLVQLGS